MVKVPFLDWVFRCCWQECNLLPAQRSVRCKRAVRAEDLIPEKVAVLCSATGGSTNGLSYDTQLINPVMSAKIKDDSVEYIFAGHGLMKRVERPISNDLTVGHILPAL